MIVTFVGHGKMEICQQLKDKIRSVIEECINNGANLFYCGNYGAFDYACADAVKNLKEKYPGIKSIFVTPYITEGYRKKLEFIKAQKLYDEIIYPEIETAPYRFAIVKRNEYMIDSADMVIAYVNHRFGGAYAAYEYAKRKKKTIVNLSSEF